MQMIRNNVIQFDDQTKYCSPLVIVKKPGGSLRLVNNFINLNKKTVTEKYRMQDPNELSLTSLLKPDAVQLQVHAVNHRHSRGKQAEPGKLATPRT